MAKQKRSGLGGTFNGLLLGLVVGLGIAAAVAYFVMHAPMPFVDKASRSVDRPIDPSQAPDPNAGLPGRATQPSKDDLGALIATLPTEAAKPVLPPPPAPVPAPSVAPSSPASPSSAADAGKSYYLQVGAFRVLEDAESLRAQMLLLGLPVELQRAEVNGVQVNRVRVGPFERLDDMNKARARLAQEKISANVVRQ
jgi:cell division protein FtsN